MQRLSRLSQLLCTPPSLSRQFSGICVIIIITNWEEEKQILLSYHSFSNTYLLSKHLALAVSVLFF